MGRQRNNPEMKGKEEASERMLNEIEASQLSMLSSKHWLSASSLSSQRTTRQQGNYNELTANYINTKKGNRNYQQGPRGNEEYNF